AARLGDPAPATDVETTTIAIATSTVAATTARARRHTPLPIPSTAMLHHLALSRATCADHTVPAGRTMPAGSTIAASIGRGNAIVTTPRRLARCVTAPCVDTVTTGITNHIDGLARLGLAI